MSIRIKKPKFDEIIFGDGVIGQVLNHQYNSGAEEEFIIDFANLPRTHSLPKRKDGFFQLSLQKKWLYRISSDPAYHRYLYLKNVCGGPTIFDEYKKTLRERNELLTALRDGLFLENTDLKDQYEVRWQESNKQLQQILAKNELFIPPQSLPVEEIPLAGVEENEPNQENN